MSLRDSPGDDGSRNATAKAASRADTARASGPARLAREQRGANGARRDADHAGDGPRRARGNGTAANRESEAPVRCAPAAPWTVNVLETPEGPDTDARWREALVLLLQAGKADT